ncbi:MAG: biopolymer transporter ExbD [Burkholderiaceae bacterium]|nr:biopolymer transporter ExbD [Burkholderiaceae bacterium]
MADINVTPMVDVMLVLLVIFIITAPLMQRALKLDLPQAQANALNQQGEAIRISLTADSQMMLKSSLDQRDADAKPINMAQLDERLTQVAQRNPQAQIQLLADKNTRYESIAQVIALAQQRGLTRIAFVTNSQLSKQEKK